MLVLRPGALGDTLLAVPALRALRKRYSPLALAAHAGAARLLASLGEIDRGLAFDDPELTWLGRDAAAEDDVVAWMSPHAAPALRHALLVAPSRPQARQHCARFLLETLAPLGIDTTTLDQRPFAVQAEHSDEVLIHPGSGSLAKNWPAARFAEVIRALDRSVRLVVGEADVAAARAVEGCLGAPVDRLEHASLETLAARLAGCRAYLGNDSGLSHLAGLCGAHTVALFGPTNPEVWRPLGPHVQVASFGAPTREVLDLLLG